MSVTINAKGTSVSTFAVGKNKLTLDATNITEPRSWVFPNSNGFTGQVLTTDGTGNLSWANAGSGSVTNVSVITANGISGSVSNPTSTPSITITLGDITPTGVATSGIISASSFSGSGTALTNLNASNLTIGTVNAARLGTGAPSNTTFLRGDGVWSVMTQCFVILPASIDLLAGRLVNIWNDSGTARVRYSDSGNGRVADGYILENVTSGSNIVVHLIGENPMLSGMSVGPQYLGVNGQVTSIAPSAGLHQEVGFAVTSSRLVFQRGLPINL